MMDCGAKGGCWFELRVVSDAGSQMDWKYKKGYQVV